jgi:methionyl-tRNA formyltransferase
VRLLLLTDIVAGAALAATARRRDPGQAVILASSRNALDQAFVGRARAELADLRLIGFFTGTIVPKRHLQRLTLEPVNFHPGPPSRPGRDPLRAALADGDAKYGVTLHIMAPAVDSGPILAHTAFPLPAGISEPNARYHTYLSGFALFEHALPRLLDPQPLPTLAGAAWR